jgi:hypothetical protein
MTKPSWSPAAVEFAWIAKKINFSQVFAGQAVGIKEVHDDIWLGGVAYGTKGVISPLVLVPNLYLELKGLKSDEEQRARSDSGYQTLQNPLLPPLSTVHRC